VTFERDPVTSRGFIPDPNGEERLGGARLVIRLLHTLPADHPFRNGFDEANPVCRFSADDYASVRDAVLHVVRRGGPFVAFQLAIQSDDATRLNRLRQLATQPPPIWGCRTISTFHRPAAGGSSDRTIVLHGDQPDHQFEAHIFIDSVPECAMTWLQTTELPEDAQEGAAAPPETVRVVREVMGDDAQVVFGNKLAIAVD